MKKVYILGGRRTPIAVKNNRFKNIRPEHLGAALLQEILQSHHIADIDGIFGGNAVGTGGNITRLMMLEAGIDSSVPACTIDMQCASAAAAVDIAYAKLACGAGKVFLAGGMESSSLQPIRVYDKKDDRFSLYEEGRYKTAQFSPKEYSEQSMLEGAERVAKAENIEKSELDFWTLESHRRAQKAAEEGVLRDLIVPIHGWSQDDGIHPKMTQRLLNRLPAVLGPGTLTTAGNACRINDGAAFLALTVEEPMPENTGKPCFRILDTLSCGGPPQESPRGAMHTADLLLAKNHLSYTDMSAIEFNEAFAVIDVLFSRRYPSLLTRYNTFGGALAYGHPYGASGAVLLLHLMRAMELRRGQYGIAAIAGAGGMGTAILLEACYP